MKAGALNRSLANFVAAFGNLQNPVEEVLSVYYRQCSIAMSCRQLAQAALYLAFDGVDPRSGDAITTRSRSRRINALMLTCGHYDNSGDIAFRVGLPGKSSVSGAHPRNRPPPRRRLRLVARAQRRRHLARRSDGARAAGRAHRLVDLRLSRRAPSLRGALATKQSSLARD